jgi:hypothetical protein
VTQSAGKTYEMDWSGVPDSALREMLRQAETRLDSILKAAIGADQRATTLMGVFGAVGVALLVSAATIGTRAEPEWSLIFAIISAAILLLVAGVMCGRAGRPIDFHIGGYEPEKILKSSTDEIWLLRYICEDLQRRMDLDRKILEKASRLISGSFIMAGMSVIAGVVVFFIGRIMSLS